MEANNLYTLKKDWTRCSACGMRPAVYVPVGRAKTSICCRWEGERTEDYINLTLPVKEMIFEQKEGCSNGRHAK